MDKSEFAVNFGAKKGNDADMVLDMSKTENEPVAKSQEELESEAIDAELQDEYTDVRSVTVALVKSYSLYRKANERVLPKRADYIGSSVRSSRILASNKEEIETYFPNIIGVAPNNEAFITRVKQYLNNIRIKVDELGKTFNTSFHYYKKADYLKVKREEEKIERAYQAVNRNSLDKLKEALEIKLLALNTLEGTKCKLGYPINMDDYLMYRHCLLYKDIAKDMALINNDPSVRFYFRDDVKEAERLRKHQDAINLAKQNYR